MMRPFFSLASFESNDKTLAFNGLFISQHGKKDTKPQGYNIFLGKVESIRDSGGNFYTYKILSFDKFIKSVS